MSPDTPDNESARSWFDSVEEMAFNDEDLCDNSRTGSTSSTTFDPSKGRRKVQALQAAYAVCLYQNWEGSDRNKRRIRRYRYSTVVAVRQTQTTVRKRSLSIASRSRGIWGLTTPNTRPLSYRRGVSSVGINLRFEKSSFGESSCLSNP